MTQSSTPALRPLHTVGNNLTTLRAGSTDAEGLRAGILQVAGAVERSLRLLLRDDESAPMPVRLAALDPEEIRSDTVLAELRQLNRITIELAANVHELLEVRRRLKQGAEPTPAEGALAVRVVERLEREIGSPTAAGATEHTWSADAADHDVLAEDELEPVLARRPPWIWGALGAAGLLLVLLLVWMGARGGQQGEIDQGIALFRSGSYADAAAHFYRHAQANPDDLTARLYLIRIHRRMNRPDLAGEELREALRIAPQDPDVQREMGFLLLDTGQFEAAVERFRSAIDLDPESPQGWVGLIRALRESGRPDAADRVLATAPAEVRALLTQGGGAGTTPR